MKTNNGENYIKIDDLVWHSLTNMNDGVARSDDGPCRRVLSFLEIADVIENYWEEL